MITFFTSLKPLSGLTAIQQRNALRSWRAVAPGCEIIVYGELKGGGSLIAEVEASYNPNIACNEFGTPLLNAMFADAQKSGRHSIMCYINGDIILLPDFIDGMRRLEKWKMFSAVARRWDLDWVTAIEFGAEAWLEKMRTAVAGEGRRHGDTGMDIFAFKRGAIGPLPEFAIGRPAWDNYLIKYLLQHRIPIVDLSAAVTLIHQNHDYAHIAKRKGDAWEGPEADQNRGLARQEFGDFNPRYYTIRNAGWIMLGRCVVPAISPKRAIWRIMSHAFSDRNRDAVNSFWHMVQYFFRNVFYFLRSSHKLIRFFDLYVGILPYCFLKRDSRAVAVVLVEASTNNASWVNDSRAFRARYPRPDYHLVLIASHELCGYDEKPDLFDEILPIDAKQYLADRHYRRTISGKIASRGFSVVINLSTVRDAWTDDCLARATGALQRVRPLASDSRRLSLVRKFTDRWYTHLLRETSGKHKIDRK